MAALQTPLYDRHLAAGGRMVDFAGWLMPVQYSGIVAEHTAVRTAAGLFDISHMGRLSISGPDALALIDYAWTNDAAGMKDGQIRYGLVCNDRGGVMDDILAYRWPYSWSMVVNASNREKIVARLDQFAQGKQVQVKDETLTTGMIAVQGPKAVTMCADLFDTDPSALKYYYGTATRCRGKQCVVSRTGYTGEDGLEIMIAADAVGDVWDELLQRGALPCGLGARDTLRLEAGMPLYGHELNEDMDPYQAGLAWAVKLTKVDFAGKSELVSAKDDPTKSSRVGLVLDGTRAAREGCQVISNGIPVGRVTSGAPSPTVGKPIAMAYVERQFGTPDVQLMVDIRGTEIPARVVALPFYSRKK